MLRRFDDTETMDIGNAQHIMKVSFRWKEDKIVAMSVEYGFEDGTTALRNCFGSRLQ